VVCGEWNGRREVSLCLNGQIIALREDTLLIADEKAPYGHCAGVMGGQRPLALMRKTKDIF